MKPVHKTTIIVAAIAAVTVIIASGHGEIIGGVIFACFAIVMMCLA